MLQCLLFFIVLHQLIVYLTHGLIYFNNVYSYIILKYYYDEACMETKGLVPFTDFFYEIIEKGSTDFLQRHILVVLLTELSSRCNFYFNSLLPTKETEEDSNKRNSYTPIRFQSTNKDFKDYYIHRCSVCGSWEKMDDFTIFDIQGFPSHPEVDHDVGIFL